MIEAKSEFDPLDVRQRYSSLSVKDLLMARDFYHYHLIHKKNVVGTAIGLYLTVAVYDALWKKFSKETAQMMADGANTLALVWDSAWKAGGGDDLPASKIKAVSKAKLQELYEDQEFVISLDLDHIEAVLK